MPSFRSIKAKIILLSGICLVASMLAVIGYSTMAARENALQNALTQAQAQATIESLRIRDGINSGLNAARSLAQSIEGLKKGKVQPTRDEIINMIHEITANNQDFLGTWTGWEPNAFDGMDASYADSPGSTSTGRFLPYWNTVGGLHLQAIKADPDSGKWYTLSRDTGKEVVMDPIAYQMQGQRVVMVSLTVPIKPEDKVLGVASIDVAGDFLQKLVNSVELFGEQADVTLITKSGQIASKTDQPDLTGKPLSDVYERSEDYMNHLQESTSFHEFDGDFLRIFVPVSFGKHGNWWCVNISVRKDLIYAKANEMALHLTLIGGGSLIIALGILWFIAGFIARPIRNTADAVNQIAEGDLSVRLEPHGRDEIAVMQSAVNDLAVQLEENIRKIEEQISVAQQKTTQAEHATDEAEKAKKQAESARSEGMLEAAEKLELVVERISSAMSQIAMQADEISHGTDAQKERITTTATAMEEMNATVLEVASNASHAAEQSAETKDKAQQGFTIVEKSIKTMDKTLERSTELNNNMQQLGKQARDIGTIMTVIEDIADQTNLLALNAAIEAARAGEAGRGFAVVADEVRKLAEKTMSATKEVGTSIEAIQQVAGSNISSMESTMKDLTGAVDMTNQSGEALTEIVSGTEESADRIRGIATAAEQQSAASEEINHAIEEINVITMETSRGVQETLDAMQELAEQSNQLAELIQKLKDEAEL